MKCLATLLLAGTALFGLNGCTSDEPHYTRLSYTPRISEHYLRDRDLYLREQPGHYDSYGGYHPYF
jgi:hypothetical protein